MHNDTSNDKHVMGVAQYIDDIKMPEMVFAGFVRSPYAHARIKHINFRALPSSVIFSLNGKEIDKYAKPLPAYIYTKGDVRIPEWRCLAAETVNFAGEAVAAIVSIDSSMLEDALESVSVDYESLPVVTEPESALRADSPLVHANLGTNLSMTIKLSGGDINSSFSRGDLIVKEEFRIHRHAPTPMEPRGIVAWYDVKNQKMNIWASTQMPFIMRSHLAQMLAIDEESIRITTPDVGGGFGAKLQLPPEYVVVCILSKLTGRPVKWVETRSESIVVSPQAREQIHLAEAAFTKEGKLLAVKDSVTMNAGAYLDTRISGQLLTGAHALQGPYSTNAIEFEGKVVLTNKCPYGPYRGFGSETGAFVLERLMNLAARKLGLDPLEIRRRNLIRQEEQPFKTALGLVYDVADYHGALDKAVETAKYFEARNKQVDLKNGKKYVGIGLSFIIEPSSVNAYTGVTNPGDISNDPVDFGTAHVRLDGNGKLSVYIGTASIGTGHSHAIAQIAANELGLAPADIEVTEGDTLLTPYDCGVRASRFSPIVLPALLKCIKTIRARLVKVASQLLEVEESDIGVGNGIAFAKRDPSKAMSIKKISKLFYTDMNRIAQLDDSSLEVISTYRPIKHGTFNAFSHTVHIPVVEVDSETGKVTILQYSVIEDCGNIASIGAVDGQIFGGVTQVIGGVFFEEIKYSEDGQLLSNTFMDYLLPSAMEAPNVVIEHLTTPSGLYGGFKGMSESPNICGYAAVVNAVEDALSPFGVTLNQTKLFPEEIHRTITLSKFKEITGEST